MHTFSSLIDVRALLSGVVHGPPAIYGSKAQYMRQGDTVRVPNSKQLRTCNKREVPGAPEQWKDMGLDQIDRTIERRAQRRPKFLQFVSNAPAH
jgi:hypothetical protein